MANELSIEKMKYALEMSLVYALTGGKSRLREDVIKVVADALGMGVVDVEVADQFAVRLLEEVKKHPLNYKIIEMDGRLWIQYPDGKGHPTNITVAKGNEIPNAKLS